jgi:hypothetical protein
MKLNGKRVTLPKLQAEAQAASVAVGELGTAGDDLVTWDADGHTVDVPPAMQPVLAAHVADPLPAPLPVLDVGSDAAPPDQLADAVTQLRAYLALAAPTNAQTIAAFKLLIRVVLFVLRRMV